MNWTSEKILSILDQCTEKFTFPMLDNGYVYLAATRMSLFRSIEEWAIVIEVFGFSPRSCIPDNHIYTFASRIHQRKKRSSYATDQAYEKYLENNPNNESRFIYPIDNEDWFDEDNPEFIGGSRFCLLREQKNDFPLLDEYLKNGVILEAEKPQVFELCRLLAAQERSKVLANEEEKRENIFPEMKQILQLEEWHHPDVVEDELPSQCETFQQISRVLVTGDLTHYQPTLKPNTAWENWPEGGTL